MYFCTAQKLNDRQARWSLYLSEFNIKLIHVPGTKMIQSNALSKRPDHGIDESTGKEEQVLLPDNLFINLLDIDLQNWILDAKDMDINIKSIIETITKEGPTNMQNNLADWKIEEVDGQKTMFYKGKNYIPKDQELWWDIVKMFHDHETAGHPGKLKTYNLVMRLHYLWPWKSQNHTIPVNLEAIQTTMITSKLFWPLYLGYNQVLHYLVYGLWLSNFDIQYLPLISILGLIRYLQIYPQELQLQQVPSISLVPSDSLKHNCTGSVLFDSVFLRYCGLFWASVYVNTNLSSIVASRLVCS